MNYFVNTESIYIFALTFIDKAKYFYNQTEYLLLNLNNQKWKSKRTPTMKPLPNHWNTSKATNWLQEFG